MISALAALAGHHQQGRPQTTQQTHEMTVPNELIGCIIGKGGSKIAEIRYLLFSIYKNILQYWTSKGF